MLQVRDAVREVFRTQLQEAPEETITEARRHLNRSYDLFVSGSAAQRFAEFRAFGNDPDQPLLLSWRNSIPIPRSLRRQRSLIAARWNGIAN